MPVQLNVEISDELDRRLRVAIATRLGGRRGDLQQAVTAALEEWIKAGHEDARTLRLMLVGSSMDERKRKVLKALKEKGLMAPREWLELAANPEGYFPEEVSEFAWEEWDRTSGEKPAVS